MGERAELVDELRAQIDRLSEDLRVAKEAAARSLEERMALGIIRAAPMAFWASDRKGIIVFWSKQAEELYGFKHQEVIGKDYVDLFVDVAEQTQARIDTATIVDHGDVWKNFLAYDHRRDGARLTMLTNSFRIWDEESQVYLQAEIGLEISDLHVSQEKHRTLREAGAAMIAMQKRALELERKDFLARLSNAFYNKRRLLDDRLREAEKWIERINKDFGKPKAEKLATEKYGEITAQVAIVEQEHAKLLALVTGLQTLEESDECGKEITVFEAAQVST